MRSPRNRILLAMCGWAVAVRVAYYLCARAGLVSVTDFTASLWFAAPIGAMSLFAGARVADRRLALGAPLIVMLVTNLAIGLVMGNFEFYAFYRDQGVVWLGYVLVTAIGATLPERSGPFRIAANAFVAEAVFYLLTNFAFWCLTNWYPHSPAGLLACYVMALPFFGRSLLGTAVYSTVLFKALAYAERPQVAVDQVAAARM